METVLTANAPVPRGHYAQAVIHNGLVYVSGQLPIHPQGGPQQPGPVEAQVAQVLANLAAVLQAAGSALDAVLRVTIYVSDMALWERVNAAYAAGMGEHRPARTVVPCGKLHFGFDVEIDAIAAQNTSAAPSR